MASSNLLGLISRSKFSLMTSLFQVQPDMSEVFVPVVDGFLVTVEEAQTHLKTLMDLIPTLHSQEKKAESLMLPAIQAGCAALKAANRPGKVIMFHSALPVAPGPGQLKNREDKKLLNTDKVSVRFLAFFSSFLGFIRKFSTVTPIKNEDQSLQNEGYQIVLFTFHITYFKSARAAL